MDVEQIRDRHREARQDGVHDVQRECHEHERELEGLGDAGQESGQASGRQDARGNLLLARLRDVDHGQRGGGQAEHQDRVEARGQRTSGRVARGEAGQFARDDAVGGCVVAVDEPDVAVDDVVQAQRDQHAVHEAVGEGPEEAGRGDELAEACQARVEDRVEVAEREAGDQGGERHHDRHEAATSEEAEIGRQFDVVVLVEQPGREQADDDAREHAVVDHRLVARLVNHALEDDRRHGREHAVDDEVAGDRGQRGRPVGLLGEADGDAHGEQQGQVGEDGVARGAHGVEERADHRGVDPAEQVVLAEPEQDACGGQ